MHLRSESVDEHLEWSVAHFGSACSARRYCSSAGFASGTHEGHLRFFWQTVAWLGVSVESSDTTWLALDTYPSLAARHMQHSDPGPDTLQDSDNPTYSDGGQGRAPMTRVGKVLKERDGQLVDE